MTVYTYILHCSDNTYYTGITRDLVRRLNEHRKGRCRYTKTRLPLSVVFKSENEGYKLAAQLERQIKNVGAKKFMLRSAKQIIVNSTGLNSFISAL